MKILVTGGSGTVGKYIVDELLHHHYTVGVIDLVPPERDDLLFHQYDILHLAGLTEIMKHYDAVVHCAGIPHPLNDPPERIFTVNVQGTFNILETAAKTGIQKVVFTSSESTLGFAFMANRMVPEYIPIDERHPLRPQDPYGLSKVIGEEICRSYSSRYGIRTVCLREPWIWVPEESMLPLYKKLIDEYGNWHKNLWTYVHVYDVARAHRFAIEKDLKSAHEIFFITAKENWTGIASRKLLEKYYPETSSINEHFFGSSALISSQKAEQLLGYIPEYTWNDLFRH